jgi:hypothetical protein
MLGAGKCRESSSGPGRVVGAAPMVPWPAELEYILIWVISPGSRCKPSRDASQVALGIAQGQSCYGHQEGI